MTSPATTRAQLDYVAPFFIVRDVTPAVAFYRDRPVACRSESRSASTRMTCAGSRSWIRTGTSCTSGGPSRSFCQHVARS